MLSVRIILLVVVFLPSLTSASPTACDENAAACSGEYVSYHPGSETGWPPVILSAPHGGSLRPREIPDRVAGCWNQATSTCIWTHDCGEKDETKCKPTFVSDLNTDKLTLELRRELCRLFVGHCPAAILNNLHRKKFDANRPKPEATLGIPAVEEAFDKYEDNISSAKELIEEKIGYGLFIDLHGHGHRLQRAELGYLIRGRQLDSGEQLDPASSSIRNLARRMSHANFDQLLRGNASFGAFLEAHGFEAVPSPRNWGTGGHIYLRGGFLTQTHGSRNNGSIDAIQIESPRSFRNDDTVGRYAKALACTVRQYVCLHYRLPTTDVGCTEDIEVMCNGFKHNGLGLINRLFVLLVALVAVKFNYASE